MRTACIAGLRAGAPYVNETSNEETIPSILGTLPLSLRAASRCSQAGNPRAT